MKFLLQASAEGFVKKPANTVKSGDGPPQTLTVESTQAAGMRSCGECYGAADLPGGVIPSLRIAK